MKRKLFSLLTITLLALTACSPAAVEATITPTISVDAVYTQVVATISAQLTQTEQARPSSTATETPLPSSTPNETATPEISETATLAGVGAIPTVNQSTANGCYNSIWVQDVTVPSGSNFKPNDNFTKTWRVKNSGTCDWPAGTKIAFVGGDKLNADTTQLFSIVKVGTTFDISLPMRAPNTTGFLSTSWQLLSPEGLYFGPVMSFTIVLPGNNPVATSPSSGTPSSGGCLNSQAISTSVNDQKFNAGDTFTQTITFRNSGTCDWNGNFKIVFIGGELFGSDTTKIRQNVPAGGTATISLDMVAPGTSGNYGSSWQIADDSGNLFGQSIYFSITVK